MALLVLLVLHAPITTWLISVGSHEELTELWKEFVLAGICVALVAFHRNEILADLKKFYGLYKYFVWLLAALALGVVFETVFSPVNVTARLVSAVVYGRIALALLTGIIIARYQTLSWRDLRVVLLCSVLIVVVFGLLQLFVLPTDFLSTIGYREGIIEPFQLVDEDPDRVRILSTLRGPNPLGWFLALTSTFILSLIAFAKQWDKKLFCMGFLGLAVVVLLGSYSRSGLVAFGLASGGYALALAGKKLRYTLLAGGLIAGVAIGVLVLGNTALRNEYIFHDSAETANVTADTERFDSLGSTTQEIFDNPLGYGLGTAGSAAFFDESGEAIVTESFVAQVGYELGIAAMVGFVAVSGYLSFHAIRAGKENEKMVGFAMLALLGVSFIAPIFTDDIVAIFGFLLLGFAAISSTDSTWWEQRRPS